MNSNTASAQSQIIPSDNPLIQLDQAHERLVALCNRIEMLASRIVGEAPPSPASVKTDSSNPYGGVVGAIVNDTNKLNANAAHAEAAMSRIEQVMGPF